jgi:hypothetical protein
LGLRGDTCDGCDVVDEVEIELRVESGIDRVCRADQKKCVAVRRGSHDGLCRDVGRSTRAVFDNEGLAKPLLQPLPHEPRDRVVAAARCKADDPAYRS